MKQRFAVIMLSFFCLGVSLARAQYYPAPPPPVYAPPPPPPYWAPSFYFPPGAGPYFRVSGGPSFYFDGTLKQYGSSTVPGTVPVVNARISYDTGFALDFGLGYAFNKYVSVGFDTGYLETWIHSVNSPGFSTGGAYIGNVPFMGELTLSLPIPHTILVPYISGAVGGSSSQFWANGYGFGNNSNGFVSGSAWDTVFAYSGSAGVRFKISPHFWAAIGYNYFATADTSYGYFGAPFGNFSLKGVQANTVMFSLRWIF